MTGIISAPFTPQQAAALNQFQGAGSFHPFTCGNDLCPGVSGMHASLVAAEDGWHCPACTYTQDWAHAFMADGSWLASSGITVTVDGEPVRGEIGEIPVTEPAKCRSCGGPVERTTPEPGTWTHSVTKMRGCSRLPGSGPFAEPVDPEYPATWAGGHALIIEFGDEEFLARCQCDRPLGTCHPHDSLDKFQLPWERHVMTARETP